MPVHLRIVGPPRGAGANLLGLPSTVDYERSARILTVATTGVSVSVLKWGQGTVSRTADRAAAKTAPHVAK